MRKAYFHSWRNLEIPSLSKLGGLRAVRPGEEEKEECH